MLFFLRHVRYCNLTAIFMPRAYSAESVTGVLDWDHDRAGGIDGDLTVGSIWAAISFAMVSSVSTIWSSGTVLMTLP